jgi:hypothetical protein
LFDKIAPMKKIVTILASLAILAPTYTFAQTAPQGYNSWFDFRAFVISEWSSFPWSTYLPEPVPFQMYRSVDGTVEIILHNCSISLLSEEWYASESHLKWKNIDTDICSGWNDNISDRSYKWDETNEFWSGFASAYDTPWDASMCRQDMEDASYGSSSYRYDEFVSTGYTWNQEVEQSHCGDFTQYPQNNDALLYDSSDLVTAGTGGGSAVITSGNYWSPRFPELAQDSTSSLAVFRVQSDSTYPFVFWLTHNATFTDDVDFQEHVKIVDDTGVDVSLSVALNATVVDDYASDIMGPDSNPNRSNVFLNIDTASVPSYYELQYYAEGFTADVTSIFRFRVVEDVEGEEKDDNAFVYASSPNDTVDSERSWIVDLIVPRDGFFENHFNDTFSILQEKFAIIFTVRDLIQTSIDTLNAPPTEYLTFNVAFGDSVGTIDTDFFSDNYAVTREMLSWLIWFFFARWVMGLHGVLDGIKYGKQFKLDV